MSLNSQEDVQGQEERHSGGGDKLDINELSALLCELDAVATQYGPWFVIHHAQFDFSHASGPYHSTQILVNADRKEFIVRVWGRAYKSGSVSELAEVKELLQSTLGPKTLCCPGNLSPIPENFYNTPSFANHSHPFDRWVSSSCKVLHSQANRSGTRVKICANCYAINDNIPVKQEITVAGEPVTRVSEVDGLNKFLELSYDDCSRGLDPLLSQKDDGFDDHDFEYEIKEEPKKKRKRGRPRKLEEYVGLDQEAEEENDLGPDDPEYDMKQMENDPEYASKQSDEWGGVKRKLETVTCRVCGKVLANNGHLPRHIRGVHGVEIEKGKRGRARKEEEQSILNRFFGDEWGPESKRRREDSEYEYIGLDEYMSEVANKGESLDTDDNEYVMKQVENDPEVATKQSPSDEWGGVKRKLDTVKCKVCGKVLANNGHLPRHIRGVHGVEIGTGKRGRSRKEEEENILDHFFGKERHPEKEDRTDPLWQKVVCDLCGKMVNSNKLKAHKNMHMLDKNTHMLDKTIKCEFEGCNKYFRTKQELKRHEQTHEMKYMCNMCGHTTNRQIYLQNHIQLVHQKKSFEVKCTLCDLVFVDHSRMIKHRNLVHYPDKYRCSECQKSFATKTLLTRHMAVHDAEGQFECDVCGRKLKKPEALKEHMRIHTGERPFACPYCDFKAISSGVLCRHKQKDHPLQWQERESGKVKVSTMHQQPEQELTEELQAVLKAEEIVHELDESSSRVTTSSLSPNPGTSKSTRPRKGRKSKTAARTIWLK